MKKSNTSNKHYFLFVTYASILIVVISSLAIISLADHHAYVIGLKNPNIISNPKDIINDKKSIKEIKKDLTQIDKALDANPNNVTALIGKGLALGILHKYSEAIPYFDKVLSIDANNVDALSGKGSALGGLHRCSEAIPYFDKALSINPN